MGNDRDITGETEVVQVTAFGHRFLELPGNAESLITLEHEGAIYAHFWDDGSQTFRFYKIRFLPSEIFEYVEAHVAKQDFETVIRAGGSLEEGLSAISNRGIAERVRSYGDYGRSQLDDGTVVDNRGCAASFYPPEMELLVCGQRPDRYELLPNLNSIDTVSVLVRIIDSFPVVARYLATRGHKRPPYEICNEYDVQDLLYASVRSLFEDARLEEWTPKHAGSAKRIDIVVPSVNAVIEVKRVRDAAHARSVGDELKVDIESYHSHPRCGTLLALIYDPDAHVVDPATLNDLSGLRIKGSSRFDVKVMVRR